MSDEWDEYAEGWDIEPTVIDYAKNVFKEISTEINLNNLSVFDFGCGTGVLTEMMSPVAKHIVALDTSSKMIDKLNAKKLKNVLSISELLSKDLIDNNQQLSQKFDLVVASSVCSFLPDYPSTLCLLKNMLKPDGIFMQWDWLATSNHSDMGLTQETIEKTLLRCSFSDIKIKFPFIMKSSQGDMPVIMAVGKNI